MKLQHVGFSKQDLAYIRDCAITEATTLEGTNGEPPDAVTDTANYLKWLDLNRIAQACEIMRSQVDAYDTANTVTTDPAAKMECMAGGY